MLISTRRSLFLDFDGNLLALCCLASVGPVVASCYADLEIIAEDVEQSSVYCIGHRFRDTHSFRSGLGECCSNSLGVGTLGGSLPKKVVTHNNHLHLQPA